MIGEADMTMAIFRRALSLAVGVAAMIWAAGAQAAPQSVNVSLNGAQETPPVETAGTGTADLTYDPATRVVTWTISYSGLSGPATMAHFHGPGATPGKSVVVVWLTKQGSAAESPVKGEATLTPEQAQQFTAGEWYINVHTQAHPAGEVRGQVTPPKG
jgi:CHRD domain